MFVNAGYADMHTGVADTRRYGIDSRAVAPGPRDGAAAGNRDGRVHRHLVCTTARPLARVARRLLARLAVRKPNSWDDRLVVRTGAPLTLALAINLFWYGARSLVLTDPAYRFLDSVATAGMVFTLFWALWRSNGAIADRMLRRPWAIGSASARNLVMVGRNFARGAIFGVGLLAVLAALGFPVGTLLAGLGIGSIAITFGAQKSAEHSFGSVFLAIDQPFRVGDFVRVEGFVGTVEDIGLRSTRFRTLDRTLVTIPNGKLSEQRLESLEARDRMRLATTISVEYGTTREQMQGMIAGLERVLRAHPQIWPGAVIVRFREFAASSLDIEVMAWFTVPTWDEFRRCREEVLRDFMKVLEGAGARFAFPTRTVHLVDAGAAARP